MLKVKGFLADAVMALSAGSLGDSCGDSLRGQYIDNKKFKGYSPAEARAIATRLCEEVLEVKSWQWTMEPMMEVPPAAESRLFSSLERLCSGEPLQYVLGYADFCGFRFRVSPAVLIPRPETEELCRLVVQEAAGGLTPKDDRAEGDRDRFNKLRIMDLCTGSGCMAWTLALLLPGSEVFGVDVSEEALAVARTQPLAEEAARRGAIVPQFILADILSDFCHHSFENTSTGSSPSTEADCQADFDIIVSNPPYIRLSEKAALPENVKNHEPDLALFVPDDDPLLFERAIADFSMKRLRPDGQGFVEINEALGGPSAAIFSAAGFPSVKLLRDFRAKFRFVVFKK